jgi:signal transduction histidine kinase/DNA-binding response OmpR family regulator
VGVGVLLVALVLAVAFMISRFTIRILIRPLALLQEGIISVRAGKFEPIQVSRTDDEIEDLGDSFNRMIDELQRTNREINQHRDLLEERIRQRTEELENAMRTALAASQAKSDFLANMSHELRTPMNGLLGMLDVTLDSALEEEQRENLETAQRSAYSLLALLNDILDLSKIEAGRMMVEKIPFPLRTVLDDCVKSFQPRAAQKKIALHFNIDAGAPKTVMGDPLRLRQIVTNLLSNAMKFTERGFVAVTVCTQPVEDSPGSKQISVQVRDTGTGIEKDKLDTIFEKFTQADGSITRKYGGTGLGLAITKRLVELQDGQVTVESEPGVGSTFTITVPYQVIEAGAPDAGERAGEMPARAASHADLPARIPRILVVEDNVVNQRVVLAILRKKNYKMELAADGREALNLLEASEPFDLVLMDIQMPVLDGLETTRLIRKEARWAALPILAMTAHAMTGDRERCLQAGMNGYISKPIQAAHLIATIERALAEAQVEIAAPSAAPTPPVPASDDHQTMVGDLLRVFLHLAPARLERLESAAASGDNATLVAEARKIAAAADQLNAPNLSEYAIRIEMAANQGDVANLQSDVSRLREEILALEATLV